MSEFDNLKHSYITTIQCAMAMNVGYQQTKQANEFFHRLCETLVDSSNYLDQNKQIMKQELQLIKSSLGEEIKVFYRNRVN